VNEFLLDTNVISQLYKTTNTTKFDIWLFEQAKRNAIYLPVMAVHEIERGISLLEHKGATAKAAGLRVWLKGLVVIYNDSILPITSEIAAVSGALEALAIADGYAPGAVDALIAGTAKHHGLTVITHNLKHFLSFRVEAKTPDQVMG